MELIVSTGFQSSSKPITAGDREVKSLRKKLLISKNLKL